VRDIATAANVDPALVIQAAAALRDFLTTRLLPVIGRLTPHPDAQLRASLVAAQLIGIATQRHVIRLEPLVKASPEEIVTLAAPASSNTCVEPRAGRGGSAWLDTSPADPGRGDAHVHVAGPWSPASGSFTCTWRRLAVLN
jgi:hypothetical protein